MINITTTAGSLRVGDVLTFEGVHYYPWYKKLWYCLIYFRHNNPIYKKRELRQFIVTVHKGTSHEIMPFKI